MMDSHQLPSDGSPAPKRRRIVQNQGHRSNNACRRCKVKKAKCEFSHGDALGHRCRACNKADAECIFDISGDGVPGGVAYTAALEERVAILEGQLQARDAQLAQQHPATGPNYFQSPAPAAPLHGQPNQSPNHTRRTSSPTTNNFPIAKVELQPGDVEPVTIFTLLETALENKRQGSPQLPSPDVADALFESAYLYTQARYPLVDWHKVREWHRQREHIHAGVKSDQSFEVGSYFIWIVYAIGARLIPSTKHLSSTYYDHAITHLHAVLKPNSLLTIQGLLALTQYHCRATCGPSPWHLVGVALRMCLEKGYHRPQVDPSIGIHETEARKRAFWCVYVFDRMTSTALQRPFGLDDRDIEVDEPINVDIYCTDATALSEASTLSSQHLTSMSFVLHHLHIYRLKSRMLSRFSRPQSSAPSSDELLQLLGELDEWKQQVPPRASESSIPQQNEDRTQAMYLQTALLLIRPVLCRGRIDSDLVARFAIIAADACENGKEICFRAQSHTSAIQMYNSFYAGITLLQCLALKPDALPLRRVLRAIKACSNTLAVYTSSLDIASTLAQLFDKLSDHRFGDDGSVIRQGNHSGIMLLRKVAMSDPSEAEKILRTVPDDEDTVASEADPTDPLLGLAQPLDTSQWLNWEDPFAAFEFNDFELS